MALVDAKVAFNNSLESEGFFRKGDIESFFEKSFGDKMTSDQRAELRSQLKVVDDDIESRKANIEAREWGQNISVSATEAPEQVIYGECRVGGIISFISTNEGDTGEFLHIFVTYAGHEVYRVLNCYVDGELIPFGADTFPNGALKFGWSIGDKWANIVYLSQLSTGTENQLANYDLTAQSSLNFPNLWTDAHRQRGVSGAYNILVYKAELFPSGFPQLSYDVLGANNIYDPRTGLRGYTNNAALCWAHYLIVDSRYGPQFTWDDIDIDTLIIAANICDEDVSLAAGGTEKRYTVNGKFEASSSNDHKRIMQELEQAMAGSSTWSGGKWYLYAGGWRASVLDITEADILGDLTVDVKPSRSNIFNCVQGKYQSEATEWEVADYPPIRNSTYEALDGGFFPEDIDLPYTTSTARAQRIAKIALEEHRQWIKVSGVFSFSVYKVRPGDTIRLTYERLGFENKYFRVETYDYRIRDSSPVVDIALTLKETAEANFSWSAEETIHDPAPNTNLPDPTVVRQPTNLMVYSGTAELDIRADGTVFSRARLVWDESTDVFVKSGGQHEIQYKKSSEATWRPAGLISGQDNSFRILDVQDLVSYDFRVRAVTVIKPSEWTELLNYVVVGKEENPTTPSSFSASIVSTGILFQWGTVSDLDLEGYELRIGATFGASTIIDVVQGGSYIYKTLASGSHTFRLRSKDTSKNFSNERVLTISISAPSAVEGINALTIYNSVSLDWDEPGQINFPIKEYNIYRDGIKIGRVNATIWTTQEATSGNFIYSVSAVDIYGNEGVQTSVSVNIQSLPFLKLLYDQILDPSIATLTDMVLESSSIAGPIDTAQTWSGLFTARSWTTWQDKIDDDYDVWGTPSTTTGQIQHDVDYGSVIDSSGLVVSFNSTWVGTGDVQTTIRWSVDGSTWFSTVGTQALASNFRYVQVLIDVTPDDDKSLVRISDVRLRIEVAKESEVGVVAAVSSDGSGTLIVPVKDFIDIFEDSIIVSARGSNPYHATWVITGNDVRVFLWDTSGSRVSGDVGYSFEGIIAKS